MCERGCVSDTADCQELLLTVRHFQVVAKIYVLRAIRAARLKKTEQALTFTTNTSFSQQILTRDSRCDEQAKTDAHRYLRLVARDVAACVAACVAYLHSCRVGCTQGMRSPHVLIAALLLLYCCLTANSACRALSISASGALSIWAAYSLWHYF